MSKAASIRHRRYGYYAVLVLTVALIGLLAAARGGAAGRTTISGDLRVGETLTSSPAGDTAVYKWQRCDPDTATCGDNTDKTDPNYTDAGQTGHDDSYTLTDADAGMMIRVQAKGTSTGEMFVPSAPVGPVIPTPVFRESAVVDPTCPLTVVEPGSEPKTVDELDSVPIGTKIDVTTCEAQLITIRNTSGVEQSVDVSGSPFKFFQRQHGTAYVVLKLVGKFKNFKKGFGAGASSAGASGGPGAQTAGAGFKRCKKILGKKKCRKLVATGDCLCSTSGALASGTVRGSSWYIQDGPGYTFAKAIVHKLLVRDKVKRKKILLDEGESYLARKRR